MKINPCFQTLIAEAFPNQKFRVKSLGKLHGDASYRVYYRLKLDNGQTYIVMQLSEGGSSASEEISNYTGQLAELPFQNVQRFLRENDIPVPAIIYYSPELHLMLLEDCGDTLLFNKVVQYKNQPHSGVEGGTHTALPGGGKATTESGYPPKVGGRGSTRRREPEGTLAPITDAERLLWYGKAVDLLCAIQKKCSAARTADCVALQRSFDPTLLNWEFAHFVEFGIEARRGEKLPEKVRKEFDRLTGHITDAIMELPYGFTHRDYQSRNLLVRDDHLVVIDFQDALRGPFIYDVVALLRDSYVPLSDAVIDPLLAQYARLSGFSEDAVRSAFDLVTVQRKLKDAGRFVYIDRVKGNPNYLPFIPTSLGYVRAALGRIKEGQAIFELLKPYVKEWSP